MRLTAVLVIFMLFATGCAFTPHETNIAIDQQKATYSKTAQGTKIWLRVVDERDETDLGRRGAGIAAAKIQSGDLMPKFTRAVEDGFQAKGFELISDRTAADAELLVALRTLKFEESAGFFTVGAEADAAVLAEAERGSNDYRNQYRSSDEDRQLAVSFGDGIDEQINFVLNQVVGQLLNDKRLDNVLTGN
jgi:uncharacterized lipoprotein YajG